MLYRLKDFENIFNRTSQTLKNNAKSLGINLYTVGNYNAVDEAGLMKLILFFQNGSLGEEIENNKDLLIARTRELTKANQELEKKLKDINNQKNKEVKELKQQLEDERKKNITQNTAKNDVINQPGKKLISKKDIIKDKERQIEKLTNENNSLKTKIKELDEDNKRLNVDVDSIEVERQQFRDVEEKFKKQIEKLENEKAELSNTVKESDEIIKSDNIVFNRIIRDIFSVYPDTEDVIKYLIKKEKQSENSEE